MSHWVDRILSTKWHYEWMNERMNERTKERKKERWSIVEKFPYFLSPPLSLFYHLLSPLLSLFITYYYHFITIVITFYHHHYHLWSPIITFHHHHYHLVRMEEWKNERIKEWFFNFEREISSINNQHYRFYNVDFQQRCDHLLSPPL